MYKERNLHKIRLIQRGATDVYGVTIPPSLIHWVNVFVSVRESGNCIILESGAIPQPFSIRQIKNQAIDINTIKI
jgi:hypothetical protein